MRGGDSSVPEWEKLLAAERHLQADLRDRFDEVLSALDGIPTGIRQLRRTAPLQVEEVEGLRVPTLPEMARIKAWLLATRSLHNALAGHPFPDLEGRGFDGAKATGAARRCESCRP